MKQLRAKNILKYVLLTSMVFAGASAIDYSNSKEDYVNPTVNGAASESLDFIVKNVQADRYVTSAIINYDGQDHLVVSGDGRYGSIGSLGTNNLTLPYEFTYPEIYEGKEIVDSSFGYDHYGMIVKAPDGTTELWMWGKGYSGQIGGGLETDTDDFVPPTKISGPWEEWETGYEIKQLECGTRSTFAVVNDGTSDHIFAWGENAKGTLGLGDTAKRQTPTEVTIDGLTNFTVEELVEKNNSRTVMAVLHDNIENQDHLYVWGQNAWISSEMFDTTSNFATTPTDVSFTDETTGEILPGEYSNVHSTETTSWFEFVDGAGVEHLYGVGYNTNGMLGETSGLEIGEMTKEFTELWNSEDDTQYTHLVDTDNVLHENVVIMEDELGEVHFLSSGESTESPNGKTWFSDDGGTNWLENNYFESEDVSVVLNEEEFLMMSTGEGALRFATDDGTSQHIYTIGRGSSGEMSDGSVSNRLTPKELIIGDYGIPPVDPNNFETNVFIIVMIILIIFLIIIGSISAFVHYEHKKNREIHWFSHGHLFEITEADESKGEKEDEK